ncbi:MAG: alkaline phosphatase family protein [Gemmatimonadota bacterium]
MSSPAARVLMIGLDAADPVLVERWAADGTLPNLARLLRGGAHGRLSSSARYLAGSPWPTFYTSQPPSEHGIYHDFQWVHERMQYASPGGGWLPVRPFWRELDGLDVVAYDVPMTPGARAFRGVEITGWASHDKLSAPDSHPRGLLADVRRRFGEWPVAPESFGRDSVEELLRLRDALLENTRRSTELALWLLQRPWRLAVVAFSALHRGGHRLWDRSSIEGAVAEHDGAAFDAALRDLYVECDRAVGRLRESAPDAVTLAFSLHGMMPNVTRVDLLDAMLARVLQPTASNGRSTAAAAREFREPRSAPAAAPSAAEAVTSQSRSLLRRAGEALPLGLRRALTRSIPGPLRDRLVTMWATGGIDWRSTPAFTLRADLQGYVRLNLSGRERRGIVSPGSEADALCDRIAERLLSFRDASTDEPLVREVCSTRQLYDHGPRRDRLPDLIVRWVDTPGASHAMIRSPALGTVARATPGRIPGGRSGNHRDEGFLLACGPGIRAGTKLCAADIRDLAPTVVRLLGAAVGGLSGRPLPELVSGSP